MAPLLSNRKLQYLSLAYIGSLICQCRQGGTPADALAIAPAMLGMAAGELLPNLVAGEIQGGGGLEEKHIWPSEHILNEHLARAVRTAVAGVLHLSSNRLEGEDQLSVLRLMNAVETHWLDLPFDLRDALKPVAETEIPRLLGKNLESLTSEKPITAEDWENILDAVLVYSNEIEISEPVFHSLCQTLEDRFIPALFSVICHEPTASSKLQILEINRVAELVSSMSGKFLDFERAIRDVSSQILRSEERIQRAINAPFAPPQNAVQTQYNQSDPISGFYFGSQLIPVVKRTYELKLLRDTWLNLDANFSWVSLLGPAGSGKSRLALELIERLPNDWDGFFLQAATSPESAYKEWRNWRPEANTVIVVDYAASRHENLSEMLRELAERGSSSSYRPLNFKVRLLCLERTVAGSRVATAVTKLNPADSIRVKSCLFSLQSLQVGSDPSHRSNSFNHWHLADFTEQDLGQIILQYFEAYGGKDRKWSALDMGKKLSGVSSASRPLFAAFLGQQLATGHDLQNWEPLDLAREILYQEVRRWSRLGVPSNLVNQYFLATVLGTYKNNQLQEECLKLSPGEFSRFAPLIAGLSGINEDELSKLEPDFLGELFVLKRLDGSLTLQDLEEAPQISSSSLHVLKLAKDQQAFQSAEFYLRAHQNFPKLSESFKPLFVSETESVELEVASQTLTTLFDENRWDDLSTKIEDESARWLLHSEGETFATAMALATESEDPGAPTDLILSRLKASNYPEQYSTALYNVIANQNIASMQDTLVRELSDLYSQHPDNHAIRLNFAKAAYSVAFYADSKDIGTAPIRLLRQHFEFDRHDAEFRNLWAFALYLAIRNVDSTELSDQRVSELENLYREFPTDFVVIRMWANALYSVCYTGKVSNVTDPRVSKLHDLWKVSDNHPSVRQNWANCLYNACTLESTSDLSDVKFVYLADCWNQHPDDPHVQRNWASALYAACLYGSVTDLEDPRLKRLRDAWEAFPKSRDLIENWANGLYNSMYLQSIVEATDPRISYMKVIWESNPDLDFVHRAWTNTLYLVISGSRVTELTHPAMRMMKQAVDAYSSEESVRQNWAKALYSALYWRRTDSLLDLRMIHLHALYEGFPEDSEVEKNWVNALYLSCLHAEVTNIDDPKIHHLRKLWEQKKSNFTAEVLSSALYSACRTGNVAVLNDERSLLIARLFAEHRTEETVRQNWSSLLYLVIYESGQTDFADPVYRLQIDLNTEFPDDEHIAVNLANSLYRATSSLEVTNISDERIRILESLAKKHLGVEPIQTIWSSTLYNLVIWSDLDVVLSYALTEMQRLLSVTKIPDILFNWSKMSFLMANRATDRYRAQEFLSQSIASGLPDVIKVDEWFAEQYPLLLRKWKFSNEELGID